MPPERKTAPVTLQDRLEHGNLTIAETCELSNRGKTAFYADVKAGLVTIVKFGRTSRVPGPIAARYARGECSVNADISEAHLAKERDAEPAKTPLDAERVVLRHRASHEHAGDAAA